MKHKGLVEQLKKRAKSGEKIFDSIDGCFDRHASSGWYLRGNEVESYEKELKNLNKEKFVSIKNVAEVVCGFQKQIRNQIWTEEEKACNGFGYTMTSAEALKWVLELFGDNKK